MILKSKCVFFIGLPLTAAFFAGLGVPDGLRQTWESRRYRVGEVEPNGWRRGTNPAQRFQVGFGPEEVRLDHRQGGVALRLAGVGYGDRLVRLPVAAVEAKGNRVEYRRGGLVEWYVNDARGLEHGFTLTRRPGGGGAGQPLVFVLETNGELQPVIGATDDIVELRSGGETVLRYAGLKSWDARGRPTPGRMEVEGRQVRLLVDDTGAEYPLTVDPVFTQQAKLAAGDASPGHRFGSSVALSGDTAVAGAPSAGTGEQGAAYVFVRNGTSWSQQARLAAADPAAGDWFGWSAALSGDTVVVGAPLKSVGGNARQGAVYVFVRSGSTWSQQAKLTAADGAANGLFGASVAVSGDTILVGASSLDLDRAKHQGSAYVFVRNGTTWTQQAKLTPSGGAVTGHFGHSVSISGEIALIGEPVDEDVPPVEPGAAYVFVRNGAAWSQQAKLSAIYSAPGNYFGYSVSLNGPAAVVGAIKDNVGKGAVHVFVRAGGLWNNQTRLTASDGAGADSFGSSVSFNGDTVVVGARGDDHGVSLDQGSAYVFVLNGTTWSEAAKLVAADGAGGDEYGASVAVSSGTLLVGSRNHSAARGAAYVYVRGMMKLFQRMLNSLNLDTGWAQTGTWTVMPVPPPLGESLDSGELHWEAATARAPLFNGGDPAAVSVTPASGTGETQTFQAVYSHSGGAQRLKWAQLLLAVEPSGGGQAYCLTHYDVAGNGFWLYSDVTGFFFGPYPPGTSTNALQGSLCAMRPQDSTVSLNGTTLTLNIALTFKKTAVRNTYLRTYDDAGVDTGWQLRGTYNPSAPDFGAIGSVQPSSGAGMQQTFTLNYLDPPGFAGYPIGWVQFLIAAESDGGGKPFCFLHYDRAGNGLWLYSSDVGYFVGPVAPGVSSSLLSSSACSIDTAGTSVTFLPATRTLRLVTPVTMKNPMAQ